LLKNKVFRSLLEKLCRNAVIKRKVRIATEIHWYFSPDAQLKYLKKSFDEDLREFVVSNVKITDIVWDIGANSGSFTAFCLAHGVRKPIVSVEPDSFLHGVLIKNMKNHHILPINAAISDKMGIVSLEIASRGRASNSIASVDARGEQGVVRYTQPVVSITLDWMLKNFEEPDIVKIDIEGAELLAIKGAQSLINKKIRFFIEIDQKNYSEVFHIFKNAGYEVHEVFLDNYYCIPKC